jgi:TPR repeat protein
MRKAVRGGHPEICMAAAEPYEATGATPNPVRARSYHRRACQAEHGEGCYLVGINYQYGDGVEKDLGLAKELYGLACEYGYEDGCGSM